MSRGLGRIERAIVVIVDDEVEDSYAAEDLAVEIYQPEEPHPDNWWPTRAQRVGVLRAMHSLARKYPDRFVLTGGKGREPLWLARNQRAVKSRGKTRPVRSRTDKPREGEHGE